MSPLVFTMSYSLQRKYTFLEKKKLHDTKAQFQDNGQNHNLSIEYDTIGVDNLFLAIRIDSKMVIQVKHFRWKFLGNQTILIDRLLV